MTEDRLPSALDVCVQSVAVRDAPARPAETQAAR